MIETKIEPVTGLYESTAYVDAMDGRAATWIPAHVYPIMTIIYRREKSVNDQTNLEMLLIYCEIWTECTYFPRP